MASESGTTLLTWVLTGTGALLVYSAVKNRAPWDVLRGVTGDPIDTPNSAPVSGGTGNSSGGSSTGSSRVQSIANRQIPPTMVRVSGGGQLDQEAAASWERVVTQLGWVPRNVGMYRPFALQAMLHAKEPNRFATANGSMHVVGLAVDIHADDLKRPGLVEAMTSNGWNRYDPVDEAWHFSYGVTG